MTIRLALPADAEALGQLHVESWRAAYSHLLPADFLESLDPALRTARFSELIAEGITFLVADDGRIHGFCSLGPSRDCDGWGEVYAIYLRPSSWGKGLGTDLLREAERRLASSGFERAMLWVLEGNTRARAFYERSGWRAGEGRQVLDIGGTQTAEMLYELRITGPPGPDRPDR